MKRNAKKARSFSFVSSSAELARIRGGVVSGVVADNKHPEGQLAGEADWNGVTFQPNDIKAL